MVENTTETEAHDVMAYVAIDVGYRMTVRLAHRRTSTISNMTGITRYTRTLHVRAGMVRVSIQKTGRGMTVTAFRAGIRVATALEDGGRLTSGHRAIVATGASADNIRMIKATVQCPFQKADGIVAVITFSISRRMKFGFTDSRYAIMTFAAMSKNFQVISKGNNGSSLGCMTGLTHITGSDVIR